ncbi:MAG: hypothetical protein K8S56_02295, partial [Candidatus Cloacimonetes bacterium]|nr:hypothetical protein [Candidatus Cloacimonadota bacterium]
TVINKKKEAIELVIEREIVGNDVTCDVKHTCKVKPNSDSGNNKLNALQWKINLKAVEKKEIEVEFSYLGRI